MSILPPQDRVRVGNAPTADVLRDQFTIRPASNGYIIAETRGGAVIIEWVVEGDLTEVGKMIEGIAADRKLRAADMAAVAQTYASRSPAFGPNIADIVRDYLPDPLPPGVALKPPKP